MGGQTRQVVGMDPGRAASELNPVRAIEVQLRFKG